ncbi:calcium/sodium antiporter [Candidatus Pacearchaeota archaeon]|nr:calcium/sodium antiporter [Candidatus Pacearchaeota archaeon]
MIVYEYVLFAIGIVLLVKGGQWLVNGASSLAKKLGISSLVIGLTIVAFGTSTPELVVNLIASISGNDQIVFGNIIGSNIANILLVLGATATIHAITVPATTVRKEIPFAFLAVAVLFFISNKFLLNNDNSFIVTRADGLILLAFFAIFIYYAFGMALSQREKLKRTREDKERIEKRPYSLIIFYIILGLICLYFGGLWTVRGAVYIAEKLGLSQFFISATIVALGTSLPELTTSITAALKKDINLSIGTIVGSNIFNIFWILGLTAIVSPVKIPIFINLDLIILGVVTLLLFTFTFLAEKSRLERKHGILFLWLYIAYIILIISRG